MILFSDFDWTLYYRDNEERTFANLEAIKKWRAAGHHFCITTGRSYESVMRQFPQIKDYCDYYIVDSGSIILNGNGRPMKVFCFDPEMVMGIAEFAKGLEEVPVVLYYTPDSENTVPKTENVTKIRFWFKDAALLPIIAEKLRASFPVFAFPQEAPARFEDMSDYKGFVEIIPMSFGKGFAIKALQQAESIPTEAIVTVGDGLNDYDMVRNYDGYAIKESMLADSYKDLKTVSSVAELVGRLI